MRHGAIGAWAFGCLTGMGMVLSLLTHGAWFWISFIGTLLLLALSLLQIWRFTP